MSRIYGSSLTVVKVPKSGGVGRYCPSHCSVVMYPICIQVVELDLGYRDRVHNYQLHTYMYGQIIPAPPGITSATLGGETLTDLILSPSSTVINFGDLKIYRIGAGTQNFPCGTSFCISLTSREHGAFFSASHWVGSSSIGNAASACRPNATWIWSNERSSGDACPV
jgi:hypothetical protein